MDVLHVTIDIPFNDKSVSEKEWSQEPPDVRYNINHNLSSETLSLDISMSSYLRNSLTWYFQEHRSQSARVEGDSIVEERADNFPPCMQCLTLVKISESNISSLLMRSPDKWKQYFWGQRRSHLGMIKKSRMPSATAGSSWLIIFRLAMEKQNFAKKMKKISFLLMCFKTLVHTYHW